MKKNYTMTIEVNFTAKEGLDIEALETVISDDIQMAIESAEGVMMSPIPGITIDTDETEAE